MQMINNENPDKEHSAVNISVYLLTTGSYVSVQMFAC